MPGNGAGVPTETQEVIARLIAQLGARLLDDGRPIADNIAGYPLREELEDPTVPVDPGEPVLPLLAGDVPLGGPFAPLRDVSDGTVQDWSRWGRLLRTG